MYVCLIYFSEFRFQTYRKIPNSHITPFLNESTPFHVLLHRNGVERSVLLHRNGVERSSGVGVDPYTRHKTGTELVSRCLILQFGVSGCHHGGGNQMYRLNTEGQLTSGEWCTNLERGQNLHVQVSQATLEQR